MKCQLSSCQFSRDKWQCPSSWPTILCFLSNHRLDRSAPGHCTAWKALPFFTLCSGVAHFTAQDSFVKIWKMVTQIISQQTGPHFDPRAGTGQLTTNTPGPNRTLLPAPGELLTLLCAGCRSCLPQSGDPAGRTVSPTSLGPCGAGAGSDYLCAPAPSTLTYE